MPRKYTDNEIQKALEDSSGNVTAAAKALGCSRHTIYSRKAKAPKIETAWQEGRKYLVDIAKDKLKIAVEKGERWAVEFTLRTLGKDEGFSERTEQAHTGSVTLHFDKEDAGL